ncbi:MAG TPA: hypothetical protein VFF64_24900 [Candidatus Eremiobacteraceae bacterium]|nr:hypothetical protein [Candidatus Eremiobacteraceae bacterium]
MLPKCAPTTRSLLEPRDRLAKRGAASLPVRSVELNLEAAGRVTRLSRYQAADSYRY